MSGYVVVYTPKRQATIAAWLMEWEAVGPFPGHASAVEYEKCHRPDSDNWQTRIVELVAAEALAEAGA